MEKLKGWTWHLDGTIRDGEMNIIFNLAGNTPFYNKKDRLDLSMSACAPKMYNKLKEVGEAVINCKNEIDLADAICSMSHDIEILLAKARGKHE